MSDASETVEDTKKGSLAEVTDDSCTARFQIVPLNKPSDDYHTSEFIYLLADVKQVDLWETKRESADENDNGDSHCYVKQEPDEETERSYFPVQVSILCSCLTFYTSVCNNKVIICLQSFSLFGLPTHLAD